MARGLVVAVGGAALLAAGLAGCSNSNRPDMSGSQDTAGSESSVTSSQSGSSSASATVAAGMAKLTVDGQSKDLQGQVVCAVNGSNLNIGIGEQATGVAVVMAQDASSVTSVGLGNVNGVSLGYQQGAPGGSASASKDGNVYTINGTATGVDMANPLQPVTKPFTIEVSCP